MTINSGGTELIILHPESIIENSIYIIPIPRAPIPETGISFPSSSPADFGRLHNLGVNVEQLWLLNTIYFVYVYTSDSRGVPVDVLNVSIEIFGDITYEKGEILRISPGQYSRSFLVSNYTNSSVINLRVTAHDRYFSKDSTYIITLERAPALKIITKAAQNIFFHAFAWTYNILKYNIYMIMWILLVVIIICFLFYRRKTKGNWLDFVQFTFKKFRKK